MKKNLLLITLCFFVFSCKKESSKIKKSETTPKITVQEAKDFLNDLPILKTNSQNESSFDAKSLLEKIDWKSATLVDSGKILTGHFEGKPTENNFKRGFRKAVFRRDETGKLILNILEFIPEVYHLWKYKGINSKSFDGKIMIYDGKYQLIHGYKYEGGRIIAKILPVKESQLKEASISVNDFELTTCTQEGFGYSDAEGNPVVGVILKCNTEYIFTLGTSTQLTQVENNFSTELIGDGAGGQVDNFSDENPVNYFELESTEDAINLKDKLDCFKNVPDNSNTTYTAKLCADLPNNNNPNALVGPDKVGHAFVTLTKSNGSNLVSITFGFYPEKGYKSLLTNSVNSQIEDDGTKLHEYNASINYNLSASSFENMINTALLNSNNQYSLSDFNCTDFAVSVINSGLSNKVIVNDWIINNTYYNSGFAHNANTNYGTTPSGLYKKIKELKNNGNSNASTSTSNASKSSTCN